MKKLFISILISVLIFTSLPASVFSAELHKLGNTTTVVGNMKYINPNIEFSEVELLNNEGYMGLSHINNMRAFSFWKDAALLKSMGIKKLYIYMNSWGGELDVAFAMVNIIEGLKKAGVTVVIEAPGMLGSAAVFVYSSASSRVAGESTILMFHPLSLGGAVIKKEKANELFTHTAIKILKKYSNLTEKTILKFIKDGSWIDVKTAKKYGIVDIIK